MADDKGSKGGDKGGDKGGGSSEGPLVAYKEIWIGLFVILAIYIYTGAYKEADRSNIFIRPLPPIDDGETYGGQPAEKRGIFSFFGSAGSSSSSYSQGAQVATTSSGTATISSKKDITLGNLAFTYQGNPNYEYFTIGNTGKKSLLLSGLFIENARGERIQIPRGTLLPLEGSLRTIDDIILAPGEQAHIVTGNSPIGTSFKENVCSGYLGQLRTIIPPVTGVCPGTQKNPPAGIDGACLATLQSIPTCTQATYLPNTLSSSCVSYINATLNYNSCVGEQSSKRNFYRSTWRVYLGHNTEFWKNTGDTIILKSGNITLGSLSI